jgi:iron complex outermembrane receptor protein
MNIWIDVSARAPLRRLLCGTAFAALVTAYSSGQAFGQGADTVQANAEPIAEEPQESSDRVTVTARKREESLREVPMAASVVDAVAIQNRGGIADTGGIVSATPGARFNDLAFSTLSEVSLRSSGTARGTNAETGVGLYANGVYVGGGLQFSRNYTRVDFFDLERAEVLRGTLGALYGRNAVGGAVNLIAKKPEFAYSGRLQTDYGWDIDRTLVQAVINVPVSDSFAIRFGTEYANQEGGNYHNTSRNRYADELDGWITRLSARLASGPLDATLMLQNQDMKVGGGAAVLTVPAGTGCPATAAAVCYLQGYNQDRYAFPHSTLDQVDQSVRQAVLDVGYELGWADLTSVTSFRRRDTSFVSDNDLLDAATLAMLRATGIVTGGPNQRTDAYQELVDVTQTWYQDLHLAGEVGGVDWMAGLEYLDIEGDYEPRQTTNGVTRAGATSINDLEYQSIAAYGSLAFDVTDHVNLSGELRYTDDDKQFQSTGYTLPALTINVPLRVLDFANSNWSYNAVVRYTFDGPWMAYAKVGSGYRAGGFNSGNNPPPPAIPPRPVTPTFGNEDSTTWEAGAKGNLTDDLYVTLAAYATDTSDAISQIDTGCFLGSPVCNARPTNFAINAGEAKLAGVETEAIYSFHLGAANGSLRGTVSRQWGDFEGGPYDGFEVPQKPDWTASANLNLTAPVGSMTGLINVNYRGQWGGVESIAVGATAPKPLSDYQIIDIRTGLRFDSVEIAVYVNNVTDEQFTLLDSATTERWSTPRTAGVQLRYNW